MRFLTDVCLHEGIAEALRARSADVVSMRAFGATDPDPRVMAIAAETDRIVLTSDNDLPRLALVDGVSVPGIVHIHMKLPCVLSIDAIVDQVIACAPWGGRVAILHRDPERTRIRTIGPIE